MRINFKLAYLEAFNHVQLLGILVYDTKIHGPGMAFDLRFGGSKRIICIDGSLSYKKRLFVLLHEIGHLFYLEKLQLKPRKATGSEKQANKTVVRLLGILHKKHQKRLANEFARYYNSMAKGTHRARFYPET